MTNEEVSIRIKQGREKLRRRLEYLRANPQPKVSNIERVQKIRVLEKSYKQVDVTDDAPF